MHLKYPESSNQISTLVTTTGIDFLNHFSVLKQQQFSGQVILKNSQSEEWVIYIFLGRIFYATGGIHPVRRWYRHLNNFCPEINIEQIISSTNTDEYPNGTFSICWEYQILNVWIEQRRINREQAIKVVGAIVGEVLFDVIQAMQVNYQLQPGSLSLAQLVLIDPEQLIIEVKQVWATWQGAKIADRLPNCAPIIKQPEVLQQQTSSAVFQALKTLLDGKSTLRDLAVKMKRDVVSVTQSLLPYMQAGLVELVKIPDLTVPSFVNNQSDSIVNRAAPIIACIDDSPVICQGMERILTTAGYQFFAVSDSLRAIATILIRKPDLIFLDLVMPHTNGYEICSQLRKVSAFRHTPIVILTGNDGIIDRVRAKMVKASGFISKPVNSQVVLEVVKNQLSQRV